MPSLDDDDKYRPKGARLRNQLLAFIVLAAFCVGALLIIQEVEGPRSAVRPNIDMATDALRTIETQVAGDVLSALGADQTGDSRNPKLPKAPKSPESAGATQVSQLEEKLRETELEIKRLREELASERSRAADEIQKLSDGLDAALAQATAISRPSTDAILPPIPAKSNPEAAQSTIEQSEDESDKKSQNGAMDDANQDGRTSDEMNRPIPPPTENSRPKPNPIAPPVPPPVLPPIPPPSENQPAAPTQTKPKSSGALYTKAIPEPYAVEEHSKQPLDDETRNRQQAVKEAMEHAWKGYKEHAWGQDELLPLSKSTDNAFGLGLTMIDSLDTLWIMGMTREFNEARDWIASSLQIKHGMSVSVFETMIRVVGGLLSAYDLSGDEIFLTKVRELVDVMSPAFNSPSGIPYALVSLGSGATENYGWAGRSSVVAEAGSVQIELRALSHFTGDERYALMGDKAFWALDDTPEKVHGGLYPVFISNSNPPRFTSDHVSVGAMGDSFYEYMLKLHLLTHNTEPRFRKMYEESMVAMMEHLVKTSPDGLTYVAEMKGRRATTNMEHLTCFVGGMLALGVKYLENLPESTKASHMNVARGIAETCYQGYKRMKTGIAPEAWEFRTKLEADSRTFYKLRPEAVETMFYMYRLTNDSKYRDMGWEMFQNMMTHLKVEHGFSGIENVNQVPVRHNNRMESFFLAETLKYLYLLFSPTDLISLDEFVFNTEAHPVRKFRLGDS